jgi:lipopolysaccharide/colanic/teichoic acid biosynthesis glycosyltransferase
MTPELLAQTCEPWTATSAADDRLHVPQVLDAPLFRTALRREQRRTERAKETFVLLLLRLDERLRADSPAWRAALEALSGAKRDSDLVGWVEEGACAGVLLTEIAAFDAATGRAIEERFRHELSTRMTSDQFAGISMQLRAAGEAFRPAGAADAREDPLATEKPAGPSDLHRAAKRALDVAGSLALLVAFAPLLALIALAVKLGSRGPVFFRQVRVGQGMTPFTMLKFRTMYTGVDHALHQQYVTQFIKAGGQASPAARDAGGGHLFKMAGDPRVTPVGRLLRKTSLDELPQFWNVLRGDMSLVGPRPPLFYEVEQYQKWHRRRVLEAKPGITGLWQVTGRSRTTFDEMVRLDLRYARTASLAADVRILLATPAAVIAGRGAC